MDSLIDSLLKLQKQHTCLFNLREKARTANVAVTVRQQQVADAMADLESLNTARMTAQVTADAKELEVKSLQGKIEKYRGQLNLVKTNKEYKAIQNEIQFAGIELRRFEDQELAAMDELEQIAQRVAEATDALARAEQQLQAATEKVAAQTDAIQADIRKAERDRADIADQLPADALDMFDRVAAKHQDGAMAPLVRDEEGTSDLSYSCGGCFMQLTQNVYVRLLGDREELITCRNCSRILYLEP